MKLTVKLPGGGWIRFEKKPMSEDAAFTLTIALCLIGFAVFLMLPIWMLR